MPNWCNSDYTFTGKEEEIIDFHDRLISITSKKRFPNDFGNSWLVMLSMISVLTGIKYHVEDR